MNVPVKMQRDGHFRQAGFSYIEVLIATLLITVALVPAIDALSTGLQAGAVHLDTTENHHYLVDRMEALLAESYSDLELEAETLNNPATPSTFYSDSVTMVDGRTLTRQVYLSRYDADNDDADGNVFTDTDDGLLWVRVELVETGLDLERLVSSYE